MESIALEKVKPLHQKALAAWGQKDYAQVKNLCLENLKLVPTYESAMNLYMLAVYESGGAEEAIRLFEGAIEKYPDRVSFYTNLGAIYTKMGKLKEADALYDRSAVHIQPTVDLYHNHGILKNMLGDSRNARQCFEQAIAMQPDYIASLIQLVKYRDVVIAPEGVEALEQAYHGDEPLKVKRHGVAFALATIYEKRKEYDKAFEYFALANEEKRKLFPSKMAEQRLEHKNLQKFFAKEAVENAKVSACDDATPIFIVGMPRSGTSLVEQILASHPDVFGAGELREINNIVMANPFSLSKRLAPEVVAKWKGMGEQYLAALRAFSVDAKYVTDKMPFNYKYIPFIKLVFPKAKIIHCMRHPVSTCFSMYKTNFSENLDFTNNLDELAEVYQLYTDMMQNWRELLGEDAFLDVQYEELVNNPQENMRKLLDYCGLEWDDNVARFYETKRPTKTASINQVNQPLYTDSLAAWKPYEQHLQPLLDGLKPLLKNNMLQ